MLNENGRYSGILAKDPTLAEIPLAQDSIEF